MIEPRALGADDEQRRPRLYSTPRRPASTALPGPAARYLDGSDLLAKTQALRVSTVDAEGWPHASLLSAGDMLALPSGRIRLVVFPQSATTANLMRVMKVSQSRSPRWRDVRASFEVDARAPVLRRPARLRGGTRRGACKFHKAPYAAVSGGVTFTLHEPLQPSCRDGKSRSPR